MHSSLPKLHPLPPPSEPGLSVNVVQCYSSSHNQQFLVFFTARHVFNDSSFITILPSCAILQLFIAYIVFKFMITLALFR